MAWLKENEMKKFWIVILLMFVCLFAALSWEYIIRTQTEEEQLAIFEKRLHREERHVDEQLRKIVISKDISNIEWKDENVILVAFERGELRYWSSEQVGETDLYNKLKEAGNLVKINNIYYDIRRHSVGDIDFFALIFLKDDYPYTNNYIKNNFNSVFGVNVEDAESVILHIPQVQNEPTVYNREGERLFQVERHVAYENFLPNYFVLILYLVFLYLLFYAYEVVLDRVRFFRVQLIAVFSFFVCLVVLRVLMVQYQIPYTLYHFAIFQADNSEWNLVLPVGDLFLTMFCLTHFLYITLNKLRIKYQEPRLIRYRYLFLLGFVFSAFLYTNFLHFSINSLIENTQVSLNIARFLNIDFSSVVAFITLILGGMGLFVLINGSVRYFYNIFSLREVTIGVVCVLAFCAALCYFFDFSLTPLECLFTLSLYILFILNVYLVKPDAQKSIFMIALVVVSVYVIFLSKSSEVHREITIRARCATEIIGERDSQFEKKLMEIDQVIKNSRELDSLVGLRDEEGITRKILNELTDLSGFYFDCRVFLCTDKDSLLVEPGFTLEDCSSYFRTLIDSTGVRIQNTSFYNIDDFDGVISYVGLFDFNTPAGPDKLYLRFDSKDEGEAIGYSQVLSKEASEDRKVVYPYSYAKYKDGVLLTSHGEFNYYKRLEQFGETDFEHVEILTKDHYSHMIIPVGKSGVFVISLGDDVFALYYLNVLYAIFVCVLFSSYGLFFRFEEQEWINFRRETLKRRIKNNIISLISALFIIMTVMSIVVNTDSVERKQSMKVVQISKYISKELEKYDCIDVQVCPQIQDILYKIASMLWVDINIYDQTGTLVATSQPVIFEKGFRGTLLNPIAYRKLVKEKATSFVQEEKIGELDYMAAYVPMMLENGEAYVLNIPYFTKSDELNVDIMLFVIIAINIAVIVMVLAFIFSGIVAERVTKPLQMVNEKLRLMRVGGKNEKIVYNQRDEVGMLVREYNGMVDKLEDSVKKLAKSERETAWREMARQIAHEIKNPLTPMKLNIQFLQRTLQGGNVEEVRQRFKDISSILVEQIDHMASIASAFSDFAKMPVANSEWFNLSELVQGCTTLFENNVDRMICDIEPDILVYGDKDQVNRVIVNLLKNATQSIPEGREGLITVTLTHEEQGGVLAVRDNGAGIPEGIRNHISEPNFTTKSGGMGLGLAMSYKIIESMGGTITFESEEGVGTVFRVSLKSEKI